MKDKLLIVAALVVIAAGVYAYYHFAHYSTLVRTIGVVAAVGIAAAIAMQSAPGKSAWEFAKASRIEVRKVVWPTQRETTQTTLVVIAFVIAIGVYIWLVDLGLAAIARALLAKGS